MCRFGWWGDSERSEKNIFCHSPSYQIVEAHMKIIRPYPQLIMSDWANMHLKNATSKEYLYYIPLTHDQHILVMNTQSLI